VFADKNMLTTVLLNLTTNAVKYSYPGGVITITAEIKNGMAEISVSDTGTGMGAETINKLFTPEKKVSVPGTAYEKGSGLGLILCKDFIERHHGKIWVESDPGKGSRFIFRIPQKPD
jgi:signal transduction histidine kinase